MTEMFRLAHETIFHHIFGFLVGSKRNVIVTLTAQSNQFLPSLSQTFTSKYLCGGTNRSLKIYMVMKIGETDNSKQN